MLNCENYLSGLLARDGGPKTPCKWPSPSGIYKGNQFTSSEYRTLLKEYHITQSMDGRKRWADNIMVERWFRSLKQEEIYTNEYRSPRELRHAIGEYIRKYNSIRPPQALEIKTPDTVYYASFSRSATNAASLDSAPLAC